MVHNQRNEQGPGRAVVPQGAAERQIGGTYVVTDFSAPGGPVRLKEVRFELRGRFPSVTARIFDEESENLATSDINTLRTILGGFSDGCGKIANSSELFRTIKKATHLQIEFLIGGRQVSYQGALAMQGFCSQTYSGTPDRLSELTCPNTGFALSSLRDPSALAKLAENPDFGDGAVIMLADGKQFSILNQADGRLGVTLGLKSFAERFESIVADIPHLADRMGDEIIAILPLSLMDNYRKSIIACMSEPIVLLSERARKLCELRNLLDARAQGFTVRQNAKGPDSNFVGLLRFLVSELQSAEQLLGGILDSGERKTGSFVRATRFLARHADSLSSKIFMGKSRDEQFKILSRVAGAVFDLLTRTSDRLMRVGKVRREGLEVRAGTFDLATINISRDDLRDVSKVDQAIHLCARLVSRGKKGTEDRAQNIPFLVGNNLESSRLQLRDRDQVKSDAIGRRSDRYQQIIAAHQQIPETDFLGRLASSAKLVEVLFGHNFIRGVFQLRALVARDPVRILGLEPGQEHILLKLAVNLKPFNDMGIDLGDKAMRQALIMARKVIPHGRFFIEGGELSIMVPTDSNVVLLQKQLKENVEKGILVFMRRKFFSNKIRPRRARRVRKDEGARREEAFYTRATLTNAWKKMLARRLNRENRQDNKSHSDAKLQERYVDPKGDPFRVVVSHRRIKVLKESNFHVLFGLQ